MHDSPGRLALSLLLLSVAALALAGRQLASLSAVADEPQSIAQAGRARKPRPPSRTFQPPVRKPVAKVPAEPAVEPDEPIEPYRPLPPLEFETISLAGGRKVQVEKWGDTFEACDYQPPVDLDDPRVEEVVWFKDFGDGRGLTGGPDGMQVDSKGRHLYWSYNRGEHPDGRIMRSTLDGQGVTDLVEHLPRPRNLVLDVDHDRMYWLEGIQTGALKSARLDGKDIATVAEGLNRPFGLAIDPMRGELYYWEEPGRVVRVTVDGSADEQFVGQEGHPWLQNPPRGISWNPKEEMFYWVGVSGTVYRTTRKAARLETCFHADLPNEYSHCGFDHARRQIVFASNSGGYLLGTNLDGSERQPLVVTPPRSKNAVKDRKSVGIDVAFDESRGVMYFSGLHFSGIDAYSAIFRMKIPPRLKREIRPAPPLITGLSPLSVARGAALTVSGKHLGSVKEVLFVDDATSAIVPARFAVHKDGAELLVTVPNLSDKCVHPVVIVNTPSGVTMTLRRNIEVTRQNAHVDYNRFTSGPLGQLWVPSDSTVVNVEESLVYACRDGHFQIGSHGKAILFIKNGSRLSGRSYRDCVVFHEPFWQTARIRDDADPSLRLIPVPAIRPSFLETRLTCQH